MNEIKLEYIPLFSTHKQCSIFIIILFMTEHEEIKNLLADEPAIDPLDTRFVSTIDEPENKKVRIPDTRKPSQSMPDNLPEQRRESNVLVIEPTDIGLALVFAAKLAGHEADLLPMDTESILTILERDGKNYDAIVFNLAREGRGKPDDLENGAHLLSKILDPKVHEERNIQLSHVRLFVHANAHEDQIQSALEKYNIESKVSSVDEHPLVMDKIFDKLGQTMEVTTILNTKN